MTRRPLLHARGAFALALPIAALLVVPLLALSASADQHGGRQGGRHGGLGAGRGDGRGPSAEQREAFHKRHRARMAEMLRKDVGLDEARAARVEAIFAGQREKGRALHEQLRSHRKTLRALLAADSNDQAAYKKALDGIRSSHEALRRHREAGIDAARKILTPKEQAKVMEAMMKMRPHRGHRGMRHGQRHHRGRHGPDGDDADGPPEGGPDRGPPGDGPDDGPDEGDED